MTNQEIEDQALIVPRPVGGDSAAQRQAEFAILDALARELGVALAKRRLVAVAGEWVEIDRIASDPPILVEAWAHQGKRKPAQKAKVMTDALKLLWAEAAF